MSDSGNDEEWLRRWKVGVLERWGLKLSEGVSYADLTLENDFLFNSKS